MLVDLSWNVKMPFPLFHYFLPDELFPPNAVELLALYSKTEFHVTYDLLFDT